MRLRIGAPVGFSDRRNPQVRAACSNLRLFTYSPTTIIKTRLTVSILMKEIHDTSAFQAYATLYARVRNKRYTLAVHLVTHNDGASNVLAEFFKVVDNFEVKAVYVDSKFYDEECLTLMKAHNHAYVMPIIEWGIRLSKNYRKGGVMRSSIISRRSTAVTSGLSNFSS